MVSRLAISKLFTRSLAVTKQCKYIHSSSSSLSNDDSISPRGPAYTNTLVNATISNNIELAPIYRILDQSGKIINSLEDPQLSNDMLLDMYPKLVTLQLMDKYLYKAQRMGLISFYMTNTGEEGTHFGSAAALDMNDVIYAQYREVGVLLWRGFTLDDIMNQCFSNAMDTGKGKQMPVHYGSKKLNFNYISSPLATQIPQAPGYAYGMKLNGSNSCVVCYFGDGAAQEGDCHAAMNFAATLKCPVIFICRNNGYAISTPVEEQYAGDGIVRRGIGYGIEAIRVDGNDVLAVYNATKYAKQVCIEEQRPILIEAMTYRLGSHSTSDDQSLYQDMDQVEYWSRHLYPVTRLKLYMMDRGLWSEQQEEELAINIEKQLKECFQKARNIKKPSISELFTDVYDKPHKRLINQQSELQEHLKKYGQHYPIDKYES